MELNDEEIRELMEWVGHTIIDRVNPIKESSDEMLAHYSAATTAFIMNMVTLTTSINIQQFTRMSNAISLAFLLGVMAERDGIYLEE